MSPTVSRVVPGLLALLLVAACGSGADSAGGDGERGSLVVAVLDDAEESFDPGRLDGLPSSTYLLPVYDTLIHLSPDVQMEPGLATSWEFTDPKTLQLKLREDVTFQDGADFNAEAVKTSMERLKTMENPSGPVQTATAQFDSVTAVDDYTVDINLTEPDAAFPSLLTAQLGMIISPTALQDGADLDQTGVGAGPYELVRYTPGEGGVYEAFDDYWEPDAVGLQRLEIRQISEGPARINALQADDVQAAIVDLPDIERAEASGFTIAASESSLNWWGVWANTERVPELRNPEVRQALQYAIDRKAIADAIAYGTGEPAVQIFPESYRAHSPDHPGDFYEFDTDRARRMLADAGAANLTIQLQVLNRPTDKLVGQFVQQMWSDVGVTIDYLGTEAGATDIWLTGKSDALVGRLTGRSTPYESLFAITDPEGFLNPGHTPQSANLAPVMDEMAKTPLTEERYWELAQDASGIVAEEALVTVVFAGGLEPLAVNSCVRDFVPTAFGGTSFRFVTVQNDSC